MTKQRKDRRVPYWLTGFLLCPALVCSAFLNIAPAQWPPIEEDQGVTGLGLALRKLATIGAVLYVTAHPDDENNALLAKLNRGQGIRTGLLTLTRGEGGQNQIGTELFESLGILRTEELLAAHRLDGAEQFFTRAYEFGYSFSVEETLEKWGKEEILSDIVRVIREFRPHVMITLLPGGAGGGQHHQASARLAAEAFRLAANAKEFPRQIDQEGLSPWQPLRLYQTGLPGYSLRHGPPPGDRGVTIDLDQYDPLLGESYTEFGARAHHSHRSQGMNFLPQPGRRPAFFGLAYSEITSEPAGEDFFAGIDVSLQSLTQYAPDLAPLLAELQGHIDQAHSAYRRSRYEVAAAAVMAGLQLLQKMRGVTEEPEALFFLRCKERDFLAAAAKAHFVSFDALLKDSSDGTLVPGQEFAVQAHFLSRSAAAVRDIRVMGPPGWKIRREEHDGSSALFRVTASPQADYSRPYWYRSSPRIDRFSVRPGFPSGKPFSPPALKARVTYETSGVEAWAETPVRYRWFDTDAGKERRIEMKVVPRLCVSLQPSLAIIRQSKRVGGHDSTPPTKQFRVTVQNNLPGPASLRVSLEGPAAWRVEPPSRSLNLRYENEQATVSFRVQVPTPLAPGVYAFKAIAQMNGQTYEQGYQTITYHHVKARHLYRPASAILRAFDVRVPSGLRVGYVMGVGDEVGVATEELGAQVIYLQKEDLSSGDLRRFDAIVIGVRAYLNRPDLIANNHRLLRYVQQGGHLVVQYSKYEFNQAQYAPFPARINRPHDRVTVEESPVRTLLPDHPLLHWPNRIGEKDWQGWVQERGLYFLGEWDDRYQTLLELRDPWPYNNQPKRGALVIASYGRGTYLYTGLGFFRQLPQGVPGAYRLWTNILSLGRAPQRLRE